MNQLEAVGRRIRMPWGQINEQQSKALPAIRGMQDQKEYQDKTFAMTKARMEDEKAFNERMLRQQEKDAAKARKVAWAGVAGNLGVGGLGAYLNSGSNDIANEAVSPALSSAVPEAAEGISGMVDQANSVWAGNEPVGLGKASFLSDVAEPVMQVPDFLKKWGGDAIQGAGDLYDSVSNALVDFNMDDFNFSF